MSAIVIGCGRSGTNVVWEVLAGNPALDSDPRISGNDNILKEGPHSSSYTTKCDAMYATPELLTSCLSANPHMKIIWTIRNPKDVILSKIRRGQPRRDDDLWNEDWTNTGYSDDAVPGGQGTLDDIFHAHESYKFLENNYFDKMISVRMEDVLLSPKIESKRLCEFLDIPYDENMWNFPSRMKNTAKLMRYGSVIDLSQIDMWKNWKTVYNGFFMEDEIRQQYDIEKLFGEVSDLCLEFGYN